MAHRIAAFVLAAMLAVLAAGIPGAARAEEWVVTVGGRASAVVPYEGANHDIALPTPIIQLRRADLPERPIIADDSPGLGLVQIDKVSAGPVVRLRGKRDPSGDYAGLRPINTAVEAGGFVNLWAFDWMRVHAEVRKGVIGHSGWVADGGLDFAVRSGSWTGTLGPRVGWGDRDYMNTYFGVTAQQAAANHIIRVAYSPGSGMRYGGLEATLATKLGGGWQANANFGFRRLASTAADSPIVRSFGGRNQLSGGIGLRYSFMWHS
jgi:outer membrane protein